MAEPKPSRLRQLLENPQARPRVSRAVGSLLGVAVFSIGAIGALVIWHLSRRARLIRDRLPPPRGDHHGDLDAAGTGSARPEA
jgi:hypothetical protein